MRRSPVRFARCVFVGICLCAVLAGGVPSATMAAPGDPLLADVWVSVAGSDVSGDGSEALPFRTITKALSVTDDVATVHVLPGTYHDGEVFPIVVPARVTLESTSGRVVTTIQGDLAHSVVSMPHPIEGTALVGFTISHGQAAAGAGVSIVGDPVDTPDAGWPRVTDCELRYNDATSVGGGMVVAGNVGKVIQPWIDRTRFFSNASATDGAGVATGGYTSAVFTGCDFLWNQASDDGGSIYVWNANTAFFACDIAHGAANRGGNVWIGGVSSPDFFGCDIREGNGMSGGGGMYIVTTGGAIEVGETRIADNESASAGAGVLGYDPDLYSFTNCLFEGNRAGGMGGALYIFSEFDGVLDITNCTVVDNECSGPGGADGFQVIDPDGSHSVAVTIRNSVFWQRERTPGDPSSVSDYSAFAAADDIMSYSVFRQPAVTGSASSTPTRSSWTRPTVTTTSAWGPRGSTAVRV